MATRQQEERSYSKSSYATTGMLRALLKRVDKIIRVMAWMAYGMEREDIQLGKLNKKKAKIADHSLLTRKQELNELLTYYEKRIRPVENPVENPNKTE
jgi:hypothetical protein